MKVIAYEYEIFFYMVLRCNQTQLPRGKHSVAKLSLFDKTPSDGITIIIADTGNCRGAPLHEKPLQILTTRHVYDPLLLPLCLFPALLAFPLVLYLSLVKANHCKPVKFWLSN